MIRRLRFLGGLLALAIGLAPAAVGAPRAAVSVAAAANLVFALDAVNAELARTAPDIVVTVTTGASGNLFAQMQHGAPFDVFLSADTEFPTQLVSTGVADAATLRTFATGRLVLWTTRTGLDVSDLAAALHVPNVKKIALAQPKSAPYGRAALAAMEALGAWPKVQPKLVFGENISQTAQFVETGNADLGFVALSLVLAPKLKGKGVWQEVSPALYASVPLDHAGVLTNRGAKNSAAKRYLDFLGTDAAKKILREFGYAVPK